MGPREVPRKRGPGTAASACGMTAAVVAHRDRRTIYRLLVIDDDPIIRKLLHKTFTPEGFEVLLAENLSTGLGVCETHRPDIVLLDVNLPDGNCAARMAPVAVILDDRALVRLLAHLSLPTDLPRTLPDRSPRSRDGPDSQVDPREDDRLGIDALPADELQPA